VGSETLREVGLLFMAEILAFIEKTILKHFSFSFTGFNLLP
jgi:hypothetical protein